MEVQKELYLCFIDYTKAFDRVQHDEIIKQLTQLKRDGEGASLTTPRHLTEYNMMR